MTDQSHNNQRPLEPGHRYAPRRAGMHREQVRVTPAQTSAATPQTDSPAKISGAPVRQRVTSASKPAKPRQNRSLVLKRRGLGRPQATAVTTSPAVPVEPAPVVQSTPKTHRRSRFHPANTHPALVFMGAAVLAAVLVFGGGLVLFKSKKAAPDKYTLGSHSETLGATTSNPNDSSRLNEVEPTSQEMAAYRTAPSDPRYLKVPKLQINARVVAMDKGKDGLPGVPQNIYDAGWFVRSAAPGTNGVMLVNGQVVGSTKPGVFNALSSLAVGDMIQIERGDGKMLAYKVAKIDQYDPAQITLDEALKPADAVRPGLNLLAANGRFNVKTNTFEKRLIIRTVQQ